MLSYFVNWNVEQNWCRTRAFFHVVNFLLSECCVWLSFFYFISTDPFTIDDRLEKKTKFVNAAVILWFVIVLVHACMNSLTHLIMIYHHHYRARIYFTKHFIYVLNSIHCIFPLFAAERANTEIYGNFEGFIWSILCYFRAFDSISSFRIIS